MATASAIAALRILRSRLDCADGLSAAAVDVCSYVGGRSRGEGPKPLRYDDVIGRAAREAYPGGLLAHEYTADGPE
jgi:hypothetical protein